MSPDIWLAIRQLDIARAEAGYTPAPDSSLWTQPLPASPTVRYLALDGACGICYQQPCQCANQVEPGWVDRLAREVAELGQ